MKGAGRFAVLTLVAVTTVVLIGLLLREFLRLYDQAGPDVRLGIFTAIASGVALIWTNVHQSKRERQSRLFENKRQAYAKFFEFLFGIFNAQKDGKPLADEALARTFSEFIQEVMTWGSAATINAVNEYQRGSLNVVPDDMSTLFKNTETLLRALRKDLGHGDAMLEAYGLTKLLLKADEHYKLS